MFDGPIREAVRIVGLDVESHFGAVERSLSLKSAADAVPPAASVSSVSGEAVATTLRTAAPESPRLVNYPRMPRQP